MRYHHPFLYTSTDFDISVPPNLTFYIDDIEDQWTFSYKFDMIYARMMTGSIRDWPKFIQQSYE